MALLIILIFFAIGWIFTAHPWLTLLKVWAVGSFLYTLQMLFFSPIRKNFAGSEAAALAFGARFKAFGISLVFSIGFNILAWPGLFAQDCEQCWTKLAIFLGIRSAKQELETTRPMNKDNRKAVRDTENSWQLEGESDLGATTIPDPPTSGAKVTVRLTHSNSYGPFDDIEFFVRVGDPDKPTGQFDLTSRNDWIKAHLVEELVFVDDEEILRSEAKEPFEDETPWYGTYEAELVFPSGRHSIEIKIISRRPDLLASRVLADWEITVP